MKPRATGLTEVSTEQLRNLLRLIYKNEIECPLHVHALTRHGLQLVVDSIDILKGLEQPAVQAVLVSVLAERQRAEMVRH